MSVSKLCDPLNLTLSAALSHVRTLEGVGLIKTYKQGRIRFCVSNPKALQELGKRLFEKGLRVD